MGTLLNTRETQTASFGLVWLNATQLFQSVRLNAIISTVTSQVPTSTTYPHSTKNDTTTKHAVKQRTSSAGKNDTTTKHTTVKHSTSSSASSSSSAAKGKPGLEDLAQVIGLDGVNYCQHLKERDIIIVVPSGAKNLDRRNVIRTTWANTTVFANVLFIVARLDNEIVEKEVSEESKQFEDILRIEAPDSYKGLVFNLLSVYKWLKNNCNKGFIMKIDDDMMVHSDRFVRSGILEKLMQDKDEAVVYGRIIGTISRPPVVPRTGKWAMSRSDWPFPHWPRFANGFSYVMTQPALAAILEGFQRSKYYIWCEDVYMTGILLKDMGGKLKQLDIFKDMGERGGGYGMDVNGLYRLVQQHRNKESGLVSLPPLRKHMAKITFHHIIERHIKKHSQEENDLRQFIWGTLWEMDSGTRHLNTTELDFWKS